MFEILLTDNFQHHGQSIDNEYIPFKLVRSKEKYIKY